MPDSTATARQPEISTHAVWRGRSFGLVVTFDGARPAAVRLLNAAPRDDLELALAEACVVVSALLIIGAQAALIGRTIHNVAPRAGPLCRIVAAVEQCRRDSATILAELPRQPAPAPRAHRPPRRIAEADDGALEEGL